MAGVRGLVREKQSAQRGVFWDGSAWKVQAGNKYVARFAEESDAIAARKQVEAFLAAGGTVQEFKAERKRVELERRQRRATAEAEASAIAAAAKAIADKEQARKDRIEENRKKRRLKMTHCRRCNRYVRDPEAACKDGERHSISLKYLRRKKKYVPGSAPINAHYVRLRDQRAREHAFSEVVE